MNKHLLYRLWSIMILLVLFDVQTHAQEINQATSVRLGEQIKQRNLSDSTRIRINFELGKFHIFKPGELKVDLDSGEFYLNRARQLSDSLQLRKWQHGIQTMGMVLAMERGDQLKGRALFAQALYEFQKQGTRKLRPI